jgi:hypothetical protein
MILHYRASLYGFLLRKVAPEWDLCRNLVLVVFEGGFYLNWCERSWIAYRIDLHYALNRRDKMAQSQRLN